MRTRRPPAPRRIGPVPLGSEEDLDRTAAAVTSSILGRRGAAVGHMELFLTLDCNQSCDYCFVHSHGPHADMPLATARRAIDFLLAASRASPRSTSSPSEASPLLKFDLMREVVEYASARSCALTRPKRVSFEAHHQRNAARRREDGLPPEPWHQSPSQHRRGPSHPRPASPPAKRGKLLLGHCIKVAHDRAPPALDRARMTVHPDAVAEMPANFEHLASLGINQFIIGPATGATWTEDLWGTYEDRMIRVVRRFAELRRAGMPLRITMFERSPENAPGPQRGQWGCGAGRGRITVTPNGDLYPCSKVAGVDALRETHRLGNVWDGITDYRKRGELFTTKEEGRPKCRACEAQGRLRGRVPSYQLRGDREPLRPLLA